MDGIKIEDFFDFNSKLVSSTVQAHAIGLKRGKNGIDEQWNLVKGIYEGIDFPVSFRQEYGKKWTDILDTGWPCLYLISDRLKEVLEDHHLTGWLAFPIKLYDKKNNEVLGYHGFSFIGKCSPTIYENCEIIEKRFVPNGPVVKYYKGVFIESWDGSDFFTPEKTYDTFITRKAADVLKKHKITNLELTNLADTEVSVDIINNASTT